MRELRDELEVPGYVVLYKSQAEWIKQARDVMARAEKYGAQTPKQMNTKDKQELKDALNALGIETQF